MDVEKFEELKVAGDDLVEYMRGFGLVLEDDDYLRALRLLQIVCDDVKNKNPQFVREALQPFVFGDENAENAK